MQVALFCDAEADVCVPLPRVGEPCKQDSCAAGAYCETVVSTSTCRVQLADGQECRADEACLSGACSQGYCLARVIAVTDQREAKDVEMDAANFAGGLTALR